MVGWREGVGQVQQAQHQQQPQYGYPQYQPRFLHHQPTQQHQVVDDFQQQQQHVKKIIIEDCKAEKSRKRSNKKQIFESDDEDTHSGLKDRNSPQSTLLEKVQKVMKFRAKIMIKKIRQLE